MIYINGDSWSWAEDLSDPNIWPNILGKKFSKPIKNDAIGCGSNSRIMDNVCNLIAQGETPEFAVIMLTAHHRFHVPGPNFGAWSIGPQVALNDRSGKKSDVIRDWFYSQSFSELDSVYRYYRTIWQIHTMFDRHAIPVFMFQAWDIDLTKYDVLNQLDPLTNFSLQDIDPYFEKLYRNCFNFFKNESKNWNYIETPMSTYIPYEDLDLSGHPDINGHATIAEIVFNHVNERISENV